MGCPIGFIPVCGGDICFRHGPNLCGAEKSGTISGTGSGLSDVGGAVQAGGAAAA